MTGTAWVSFVLCRGKARRLREVNIAQDTAILSFTAVGVNGGDCCHVALLTAGLLHEVGWAPEAKVACCPVRVKVSGAPRTFAFIYTSQDSRAVAVAIKIVSVGGVDQRARAFIAKKCQAFPPPLSYTR